MKKVIRMREMSDNQEGTIIRVSATGDMGRRIREMGIVPEPASRSRDEHPSKILWLSSSGVLS